MKLVQLIPQEGCLVAWGDDARVRKVSQGRKKGKILFYGLEEGHAWRFVVEEIENEAKQGQLNGIHQDGLSKEFPFCFHTRLWCQNLHWLQPPLR